MCGRCTLTTTSRPSRNVAACTCASDAAAIGVSSNVANACDTRTFNSLSTIARTSSNGTTARSSCKRSSESRYSRGSRSGRVDSACPIFTNAGPSDWMSSANALASSCARGPAASSHRCRYFSANRSSAALRPSAAGVFVDLHASAIVSGNAVCRRRYRRRALRALSGVRIFLAFAIDGFLARFGWRICRFLFGGHGFLPWL